MKKGEIKSNTDNSFGVASVVLGIVGLVSVSISAIILGIIGVIFAQKQRKILKNKWANTGLIINIISIILGAITFIISFTAIIKNPELLAQLQQLQNAQ